MNFSLGKVLGVIGGLIPIVYIGWLLRHFIGVGGNSAEGVAGIGLGPTVIGLSIVGLLFALPLIVKLLRDAEGEGAPAADPPADTAFADPQPFTPRPGGFGRKTV